VLADPSFSELFGPGSLGEAPLAATLPDGRVIAGTVDRLLIEEGRVSVLDFKTGLPRPEHARQVELYGKAVQIMHPGTRVETRVIYLGDAIILNI